MRLEKANNPWPTRIVAILFALMLFTFVKSKNNSQANTMSPNNGASVTSVEVVTDIPIVIDIDREKFFVSGLPETATIRLEGSQSILTQTLATRNFEITTPNLNELGPGKYTVKLIGKGLSSSLNYSIMPLEVDIVIEEKAVVKYSVSVEFSPSSLAEGYIASTPIVSPESVTISGAKSTIDKISEVSVVVLPDGTNITEDIEMTLPVLVFDKNGELLNVNIDQSQVDVLIPVEGTSKNIPIVLRKAGEENPEYTYELEFAEGQEPNAQVTGPETLLKSLDNLPVEIDLSGVTESTTRSVKIALPNGLKTVKPESIEVVIRVTKKTDDSATDEETTTKDTSSDSTDSTKTDSSGKKDSSKN